MQCSIVEKQVTENTSCSCSLSHCYPTFHSSIQSVSRKPISPSLCPSIPGFALTANCLVFFQLRTAYMGKEINNLTDVPFVFLFDRSGSKNQNQNSSREKVCLCMCIDACARVSVCVCVCVHVCMCALDEEGSRVFASRALGVVQTAMCLTGYSDCLTSYNCLTGYSDCLTSYNCLTGYSDCLTSYNCLTGYSDCLTGYSDCLTSYNCLTSFLEPPSPPHRCHTSSENG